VVLRCPSLLVRPVASQPGAALRRCQHQQCRRRTVVAREEGGPEARPLAVPFRLHRLLARPPLAPEGEACAGRGRSSGCGGQVAAGGAQARTRARFRGVSPPHHSRSPSLPVWTRLIAALAVSGRPREAQAVLSRMTETGASTRAPKHWRASPGPASLLRASPSAPVLTRFAFCNAQALLLTRSLTPRW